MSKLAEVTVSLKISVRYRVKDDYEGPPSLELLKEQFDAVCEDFAGTEGPETMQVEENSIAITHFAIGELE
jgi:hypothetical protein